MEKHGKTANYKGVCVFEERKGNNAEEYLVNGITVPGERNYKYTKCSSLLMHPGI